jgi:hypothetical protein
MVVYLAVQSAARMVVVLVVLMVARWVAVKAGLKAVSMGNTSVERMAAQMAERWVDMRVASTAD